MSDQPTPTVAEASTEHHWSPAPALTLLAVIVLWYMGVAALLLGHAL
jgi:hypothetical protein